MDEDEDEDEELAWIRESFEKGANDGIVDLEFCRLNAEHCPLVVDGMKTMGSKLTVLNLGNNNIGEAGARAVAEVLHHCPSLTKLNLSENDIDEAGARAVAEALHHCPSLTKLELYDNGIGEAGARAVAEALHHCPSLTELSLSTNNIGDAGARTVAEALHHCSSLTVLELSYNIGAAGARAVAEALHCCRSLTKLFLHINNIDDAGARAVAEALHHCPSLAELNLHSNSIGDEGARAVAEALHHCPSLRVLYLPNKNIGAAGARAVAQILSDRPHPALTTLRGIDVKKHADALRLPAEMADADNEAILDFLRERAEGAGPTRLAIAKVMVTGPDSAGKTCLVQRLVGGDYLRDSVQINGITETSWEEPGATGLQLHYHDFGSEEVYAASHQIVLRTRAVFLVVWSSCEADFEAHLYDVLDASPEAKLLLVCTKQDEGSIPATAEQRSELEEAYGDQIHGCFHVSSRSGAGIDELRRAIVEVAHTLEPMEEEGPGMPS